MKSQKSELLRTHYLHSQYSHRYLQGRWHHNSLYELITHNLDIIPNLVLIKLIREETCFFFIVLCNVVVIIGQIGGGNFE